MNKISWASMLQCGAFVKLLLIGVVAHADSHCYSGTKTYYEQLYCEAKSRAYGSTLPGFYDFQRNGEMTQALLLKGPARQMGITLVMPKTSHPVLPAARELPSLASGSPQCLFQGTTIECGEKTFQFLSNRPNKHIDPLVFSDQAQMGLPVFRGAITDAGAVNTYLAQAYTTYLDKMQVIGLAEATMAYGNFSYLFSDLNAKGVNFGKRFEKMYFYLKQDKQRMAVNVSTQPSIALKQSDCFPLQYYWVCEYARKNYLYRLVD